ncbi:hypothetical protein P8452_22632 [Trifolium repens]|nr:hypothetical protein P8452_22632 [Trifolium repens]
MRKDTMLENSCPEICHHNAKNIAKQKWRHRAGPISFAIIRERLRATKDNKEPPTQAEVFIETRQSKRGSQLDQVTSNAITNLQDLITNSGKSSIEVFQTVFGKEKPGRMHVGDLVGFLTTPHNDNNEVNHGCDEHLFDNSEEEEEEHLFDDLEEDEEYIV